MPLFSYHCERHGDFDELQEAPRRSMRCPECKAKAWRVYKPIAGHRVEFRDGWSVGAGKYFATKRERDNHMAITNTRIVRD